MSKTIYQPAGKARTEVFDWGRLTWYASAAQGNCTDMTIGRCLIKPGMQNPLHLHPNCAEVLVVLQGEIEHTMDGGVPVRMTEGDAITVEPGFAHNAKNVGGGDAVLSIAFSSAHRETQGV